MASVGVVGGGYAGVRIVRALQRLHPDVQITLFDRLPAHQLLTRLPEVISGRLLPVRACIPFSAILGTARHISMDVHRIDPAECAVYADTAYTFDWLAITPGTTPAWHAVPGARLHTYPVKSLSDAVCLRAALSSRHIRRVVVAGAGYTAVEVTGELTAIASSRQFEVTLAAPDLRLMPDGDTRVAKAVERVLRDRDIPLLLGRGIQAVEPGRLILDSGESLEADLVVWAMGGEGPSDIVSSTRTRADGKLGTDPYLRASGHERVFVAGDAGAIYDYAHDRPVASSAQMAVQEGTLVAHNISSGIVGAELLEFRPRPLGEAVELGGKDGVATVGGVVLTGRTALALKSAALANYLRGLGLRDPRPLLK